MNVFVQSAEDKNARPADMRISISLAFMIIRWKRMFRFMIENFHFYGFPVSFRPCPI